MQFKKIYGLYLKLLISLVSFWIFHLFIWITPLVILLPLIYYADLYNYSYLYGLIIIGLSIINGFFLIYFLFIQNQYNFIDHWLISKGVQAKKIFNIKFFLVLQFLFFNALIQAIISAGIISYSNKWSFLSNNFFLITFFGQLLVILFLFRSLLL